MEGILFVIITWIISLLIFVLVIRYAIDSSQTSKKLDDLIDEIRMLRKDIKKQSHIIDKRI
jgi:TM2 domain-containing membrane protein YozV